MAPALKYTIRAVKYFFYFVLLLIVLLCILYFADIVEGDIDKIFVNGYKSLYQIALMFACIAAVYPIFGFVKKDVMISGEYKEVREGIIEYMAERGYRLEKEEGENLSFRNRMFLNRLTRMFEDRITLTRELGGFRIEGLRKDAIRLVYGLENKFRRNDD